MEGKEAVSDQQSVRGEPESSTSSQSQILYKLKILEALLIVNREMQSWGIRPEADLQMVGIPHSARNKLQEQNQKQLTPCDDLRLRWFPRRVWDAGIPGG